MGDAGKVATGGLGGSVADVPIEQQAAVQKLGAKRAVDIVLPSGAKAVAPLDTLPQVLQRGAVPLDASTQANQAMRQSLPQPAFDKSGRVPIPANQPPTGPSDADTAEVERPLEQKLAKRRAAGKTMSPDEIQAASAGDINREHPEALPAAIVTGASLGLGSSMIGPTILAGLGKLVNAWKNMPDLAKGMLYAKILDLISEHTGLATKHISKLLREP